MSMKFRLGAACLLGLVWLGACESADASKARHVKNADQLAAEGKYAESILELKNALKVDPKMGEAREKLSDAYFHAGNNGLGAKELVRAADLLPQRADLQLKAATLYLNARDAEGAKKYATRALEADPKNITAQILLANALAGLKDTVGAMHEIEQAMQVAPADPRTYTSLGNIKAAAGDPAQAEAAFRKAVEIDAKSVPARLSLAYYLWTNQRLADAEQTLKQALEIDRDNPFANRLLAYLYMTQGRTSDAETPLLRLTNAKDVDATMTLADIYVRTGRAAQARPLYQTLSAEKGTHSIGVARLAALDYAANKHDEAHKQVDAALTEDPTNTELLTLKSRFVSAMCSPELLSFPSKLPKVLFALSCG